MSGEPTWQHDIKDLTMEKHKNAERQEFVKVLMSGNIDKQVYATYLYNQLQCYSTLEKYGMHNSLFQHSIFGAIVFLIVSHTEVYKLVVGLIHVKNRNLLMVIHAIVFALIMYFGSLFILEPLFEDISEEKNEEELIEGNSCGSQK